MQRESVLQALYSDCSERAIHWSIVLARIDLFSLYFRLLWYHSILRGSIDQKHAKTNEIWRQNSEIHSAFACSPWPPWFPYLSRPYGACVKCGSGKDIKETYVRSQSSSESVVKYLHVGRSFKHPLPWENKVSQMPYPRANNDNQIPTPCPASPARRHDIDRCITGWKDPIQNSLLFVFGLCCVILFYFSFRN